MPRFRFKPWMALAAVLLLLVIAFFGTFFITDPDRQSTAAPDAQSTAAPDGQSVSAEGVVGAIAAPAVDGAGGFAASVRDFFLRLFALRDVDKEYAELKIRVQQLELANQLMQELEYENERLTELMGFKDKYPNYEFINARVIGRDPGSWFFYFTLNRGSNAGVEKDMMVVNEKGLVGTVIETGPTSCKVMAIIDRMSSISVVVQDSRDHGMVHGSGDPQGESPVCGIYYLTANAEVVPGDKVISSDFDSKSLKGIPVGMISSVSRDKNLQMYAELIPYVDFAHIENVLIIKQEKQAPPVKEEPDAQQGGDGQQDGEGRQTEDKGEG